MFGKSGLVIYNAGEKGGQDGRSGCLNKSLHSLMGYLSGIFEVLFPFFFFQGHSLKKGLPLTFN